MDVLNIQVYRESVRLDLERGKLHQAAFLLENGKRIYLRWKPRVCFFLRELIDGPVHII